MINDLLKYVNKNDKIAFVKELYFNIPTKKEVEKTIIKSRIEHLSNVGYCKSQIILSAANEFNMSKRSIYRYIREVEDENR